MSIAVTISVTISGTAYTFTRQGGDLSKSSYYCNIGTTRRLEIQFRQGKQTLKMTNGQSQQCRRGNVELRAITFATSTDVQKEAVFYLVAVKPLSDFQIADETGFLNAILASTGAILTQVVAGET